MELGEQLGIMTAIEIAVDMHIEAKAAEQESMKEGRYFAAEDLRHEAIAIKKVINKLEEALKEIEDAS